MFGPIEVFESQSGGLFGPRRKRYRTRPVLESADSLRGQLRRLAGDTSLSDAALIAALQAILKAAKPEPQAEGGFESLAARLRGKPVPALESRGAANRTSLSATVASLRGHGYSGVTARGGY